MLKTNFYNNFNILTEFLKMINEKRPKYVDNEIKAVAEMFFYVNTLEIENRELKLQVSKWRAETNKLLIKQQKDES